MICCKNVVKNIEYFSKIYTFVFIKLYSMTIYFTLSPKKSPNGKHEINIRVSFARGINSTSGTGIFVMPEFFEYTVNEKKCNDIGLKYNKTTITAESAFEKKIPVTTGCTKITKRISSPNVEYHREQEIKLEKLKTALTEEVNKTDLKIISRNPKIWLNAQIDKFHYPEKYLPKEKKQKESEYPKTLIKLMDYYISNINNIPPKRKSAKLAGQPRQAQTIKDYKSTYNVLKEYTTNRGIKDIKIIDLGVDFYNDFREFMNHRKTKNSPNGASLNTFGKHIKTLRTILNILPSSISEACEFLDKGKCPVLTEEIQNIALTEEELRRISELQLTGIKKKIRDCFLLLCWTGCRFSDLPKLTELNIIKISNGRAFKIKQKKTKEDVIIPILPEIEEIVEENDYMLPPKTSSQHFNNEIKAIFQSAGIDEEITIKRTEGGEEIVRILPKWQLISSHTGRRTFATNMYRCKFDILAIMKTTGHKTQSSFLNYIKVSEEENADIL